MSILNITNQHVQWLNKLPIAQNNANKNVGMLKQVIIYNNNSTASKKTAGIVKNLDKILYSGEVVKSDIKDFTGMFGTEFEIVPSAQREYTVNDAINYQYNKEFAIKIDLSDPSSFDSASVKLREPGTPVPDEFIEKLQKDGINAEKYDSSWAKFYTDGLAIGSGKLTHGVDYLASGYAVAKQNIADNLTGEEKAEALTHLETFFNKAIEDLASETAQQIGGFFEENSVSGEYQKIHDSVINAYEDKIEDYSDYIKNNKNYAQIADTENAWLKNDNSYMANRLRKTQDAEKTAKTSENELYSLDELEKTGDIVNEIKSDASNIEHYQSEEEIGFKLGTIALKGEAFNKYTDVSNSLKNAVNKAISNYADTITDKLNEKLEKERAYVAEPEKVANLSKKDIFAVYDKMMSTYKTTGNLVKALQDGASFGYNHHMDKTKNSQYSNLNRYGNQGSSYWRSFYNYTPITLNEDYRPVTLNGTPNLIDLSQNAYNSKKPSMDFVTEDWNNFISKLSSNSDAKIGKDSFSAYA